MWSLFILAFYFSTVNATCTEDVTPFPDFVTKHASVLTGNWLAYSLNENNEYLPLYVLSYKVDHGSFITKFDCTMYHAFNSKQESDFSWIEDSGILKGDNFALDTDQGLTKARELTLVSEKLDGQISTLFDLEKVTIPIPPAVEKERSFSICKDVPAVLCCVVVNYLFYLCSKKNNSTFSIPYYQTNVFYRMKYQLIQTSDWFQNKEELHKTIWLIKIDKLKREDIIERIQNNITQEPTIHSSVFEFANYYLNSNEKINV
jgi:hypothetical protein